MSEAHPIETAPRTDGWILGYVPDLAERKYMPWLALTWDDSGWADDYGNAVSPTLWAELPDPQPPATGWRPAEGHVRVTEISGDGWTDGKGNPITVPYRWIIDIERPDGTYDEYRDLDFRVTRQEAEATGARWGEKYGLPVNIIPLPKGQRKVIPFRGRGDADA